jgi:hypothetical protein
MGASRNLRHKVTWWPTSQAAYGGFSFGMPELLRGRWEENAQQFRTPEGEEVVSSAIAYLSADVSIGDYIMLGDFTDHSDPTALQGAYRVRQFSKVTNLRNISVIRKAFL